MEFKLLSGAALAMAAFLGTQSPAQAFLITFTPENDGTFLNGIANPFPNVASIVGSGNTGGAMICSTVAGSDCIIADNGSTTTDPDLVTPGFGPGNNQGNFGNAVVISRYGADANGDVIADTIDDATPSQSNSGPFNTITFGLTDNFFVENLLFLDRNGVGPANDEFLRVFNDDTNALLFSDPVGPGDNSLELIPINANVQNLRVEFNGSGGVVQISAVPIPAALPLLGSAFAGLALVGWRKRKAAA